MSSVTAVAAIELSRQQLEGDLVPRADDAEVTAVERRHFGDVEPLRCRDYRGVNGAERQVAVLGYSSAMRTGSPSVPER